MTGVGEKVFSCRVACAIINYWHACVHEKTFKLSFVICHRLHYDIDVEIRCRNSLDRGTH